jgi:hypothetical protein
MSTSLTKANSQSLPWRATKHCRLSPLGKNYLRTGEAFLVTGESFLEPEDKEAV